LKECREITKDSVIYTEKHRTSRCNGWYYFVFENFLDRSSYRNRLSWISYFL